MQGRKTLFSENNKKTFLRRVGN